MSTTPPVITQQDPGMMKTKFKLVLPFASFDRSSPTKLAGSILNWSALVACMVWIYLMGKSGLMAGSTMVALTVCIVFTIATTVILSSSGYRNRVS